MPDFAVLAALISVTYGAMLAYLFGLRWLDYKRALLTDTARMDKLEADLKAHKDTHAKAINNFVKEVSDEIAQIRTKASIAAERAGGDRRPRRFGP